MRLAELSAATGVPAATIKFYLREGLLPPAVLRNARQADYGDEHVARLRLVRALAEGAGLSLDGIRRVVDAVEHPPASPHDMFGAAQAALVDEKADRADATTQLVQVLSDAGVDCDREQVIVEQLQAALDTARRAGQPIELPRLARYVALMREVGQVDVEGLLADHGNPASLATESGRSAALAHVTVGTATSEPVLRLLRLLGQSSASAQLTLQPPQAGPAPQRSAMATT